MKRYILLITVMLTTLIICCEKKEKSNDIEDSGENLFLVGQSPKYGFIDIKGTVVIPKIYEGADNFSEGLAAIKLNGKWGFINKKGKVIIELFSEEFAGPFSDRFACVTINKKEGYIDRKGNTVIDLQYRLANSFSEGLAFVLTFDLKRYIINTKGEIVAEVKGEDAGGPDTGFINGFAIMRKQDPKVKFGNVDVYAYIGKDGKFITDFRFGGADSFTEEGYAAAFENNLHRAVLIDKTGKMAFPELGDYQTFKGFREGLCPIGTGEYENTKWGYIDSTGKYVISPQYSGVTIFGDGLAGVRLEKGGKWGFINKKGELVVQPKFGVVMPFSDGMAMVSYDTMAVTPGKPPTTKWGFINTKGEMVIEPQYLISPQDLVGCFFRNGLARIHNEYINKQGKVVYSD